MTRPEPAFEAPWHAQVFALTVALNEAGHFAWTDWAEAFGQTLKQHGLTREIDGGDDYFAAWLDTLEQFLVASGTAEADQLRALTDAWREAYLRTPHGKPVKLAP